MENINQNELALSQEAKFHLSAGLKWSKVLGVLGIIIIGLGLLGTLFSIFGMITGTGRYDYYGVTLLTVIKTLVTLIFYGLFLIPTIGFLKFANSGKRSLASADPVTLSQSFEALKKALKFAGILVIIQFGVGMLLNIIESLVYAGFNY